MRTVQARMRRKGPAPGRAKPVLMDALSAVVAVPMLGIAALALSRARDPELRRGARWALVVGPVVAEVLRLTVVAGSLRTATSVDDALHLLEQPQVHRTRRRLAGA